jgi:hypothetical protein
MLPLLMLLACDPTDIDEKGTDTPADTDETADTDPTDTEEPADDTDTPSTDAPPAACINEYMSSNSTALVLPDGTAPDWIELHNPTDAAIELGGWWISDDPLVPDKHILPSSLRLRPGGFLLLFADDDVEDGDDHVGFSLDRDGESLLLTDLDGHREVIDVGVGTTDFSYGRVPDCCRTPNCWTSTSLGSPDASNAR